MAVQTRSSARPSAQRTRRRVAEERSRKRLASAITTAPTRRKPTKRTAKTPKSVPKLCTTPPGPVVHFDSLSTETTTDQQSWSSQDQSQPTFVTPLTPQANDRIGQYFLQTKWPLIEDWLGNRHDPEDQQQQQPPQKQPRTPISARKSVVRKMEDLRSFTEPRRGRKLERQISTTSNSTIWRSRIDDISPAPSLAPKGLTKNLQSSPEKTRQRPP